MVKSLFSLKYIFTKNHLKHDGTFRQDPACLGQLLNLKYQSKKITSSLKVAFTDKIILPPDITYQ